MLDQQELMMWNYPEYSEGAGAGGAEVSAADAELAQLVFDMVSRAAEDCEKTSEKEEKEGGAGGKAVLTEEGLRAGLEEGEDGAHGRTSRTTADGMKRGPVGGSVALHLLHYSGELELDLGKHLSALKLVRLSKEDCMVDIASFVEEIEDNSDDEL
jgi:hypothetical protein